jgi:hypothetical protein
MHIVNMQLNWMLRMFGKFAMANSDNKTRLLYRYHEFDFHRETRGMKLVSLPTYNTFLIISRYENISKLTNQLERVFESQGYEYSVNRLFSISRTQ